MCPCQLDFTVATEHIPDNCKCICAAWKLKIGQNLQIYKEKEVLWRKKNQENYLYVVPVLASTAHKNQIRETKQLVQSNSGPHYTNFKRFYSGLALVYAMGLWNCLE